MHADGRAFLEALVDVASPSGYETAGQRAWVDYVEQFADEVHTDAYGNAVAVHDGGGRPEIAFAGHMDEIGFAVSAIDEDGFLRLSPIGGADNTVSKGQHVVVHNESGPVNGVVGQTAIHHREKRIDEEPQELTRQHVDVGVESEAAARELVEVGDPITVAAGVRELAGSRLAGRAFDNRAGCWVAAEGFRRAVDRDVDATVYAVSTVQEEVGLRGAQMVGYDVDPDAAVVLDVTHASDHPQWPETMFSEVSLGAGPVVSRGTSNHPELVAAVRAAGAAEDVAFQLQATSKHTGTDADAFYTQRGGIPSLYLGIPNRYMHTPTEVVDEHDLDAAATLLAALADRESGREDFHADV